MDISPGFSAQRWLELDLDLHAGRDWTTAVAVFRARIEERFLRPVDVLLARERGERTRRFGFVVLAIDCLLVETLGAFVLGHKDTEGKSGPTFCHFLQNRAAFAKIFSTPALATAFYKDFRCGILHQAEIGRSSRVRASGPLLQVEADGLIVNRTKFHECLKDEFDAYVDELLERGNIELRRNFVDKMRFICRG